MLLEYAPIMPAFYSLLLPSYYSNNFANKIDTSLMASLNSWQEWGQVHVMYLYLSTFKYTLDSTCTLLKYFLIPSAVLVLYTHVPNVSTLRT